MTQLQEFIQYLNSRVGKSPYVWGGQGQKFDSYEELYDFIDRHESGNDRKRALAYAKKLEATGVPIEDVQVFDCSGYGMYFLQNTKKIYKSDKSANGMYAVCTPIKKANLKVGDWVFRGGSGRKYHIGYVTEIRDGIPYVNECKGRDDGVIKRKINANGVTYWSAFGRPDVFKSEIENPVEPIKPTPSIKYSRLLKVTKPYMRGDDIKAVQIALKATGHDPKGIDGVYGKDTESAVKAYQKAKKLEIDGIVGKITWGKLIG